MEIMSGVNINWNDVLKKEARGIDDYDLGEIQEIGSVHIVSKNEYWTMTSSIYQKKERCASTDTPFGLKLRKKKLRP